MDTITTGRRHRGALITPATVMVFEKPAAGWSWTCPKCSQWSIEKVYQSSVRRYATDHANYCGRPVGT